MSNQLHSLVLVLSDIDPDRARQLLEEGLNDCRSLGHEKEEHYLHLLMSSGRLHSMTGDFEKSCSIDAEVLSRLESSGNQDRAFMAACLHSYGFDLDNFGKSAEAEAVMRKEIDFLRALHGDRHVTIALAMMNLGTHLCAEGRLPEARQQLTKALQLFRSICGEKHPLTGAALTRLAQVTGDEGHLAEAEQLLRAGIEMQKGTTVSVEAAAQWTALAAFVRQQKRPEEALELLENAFDILDALHLDSSLICASTWMIKGLCLIDLKLDDEGVSALEEAALRFEKTVGFSQMMAQTTVSKLIEVLRKLGRTDEASEWVARFRK